MSSLSVSTSNVAVNAPSDCSGVRIQQQQGSDPPSTKFTIYAPDGVTVLYNGNQGDNYEFTPANTPGRQAFASGELVGYIKVPSGTFTFTVLSEVLQPLNQGGRVNSLLVGGPQQEKIGQIITVLTALAIGVKASIVILNCSALNNLLTIADPIAGADDGKILRILDITGKAHVITDATSGFNGKGSSGTLTFGTAAGDYVELIAYGGKWYTGAISGVTAA